MIQETYRQGMELLWAVALGAGLGLLYDLGRALRRQWPRLALPLDVVFALAFFLGLWGTAIYTQGLRLYQCLGCLLGASLYFLWPSSLILRLLQGALRGLRRQIVRFLTPMKKSMNFFKKLLKKFFAYWRKWGTIIPIPFSPSRFQTREARRNGEPAYHDRQGSISPSGSIRHSGDVPHSRSHFPGRKARSGTPGELSGRGQ